MKFFTSRVFIATFFFLLGMLTVVISNKIHGRSQSAIIPMLNQQPQDTDEGDDFPNPLHGFATPAPMNISVGSVIDVGDHYEVDIDLGGQKPENFSVQVENSQLLVAGDLHSEDSGVNMTSKFSQTISIPSDVAADKIQMDNKGDHISVILPKKK